MLYNRRKHIIRIITLYLIVSLSNKSGIISKIVLDLEDSIAANYLLPLGLATNSQIPFLCRNVIFSSMATNNFFELSLEMA